MGCFMRGVVVFGGLLVFLFLIGKCSGTPSDSSSDSSSGDVESCVRRGTAYFSSIGSYPVLSDGRRAADVARERCNRTTTAF